MCNFCACEYTPYVAIKNYSRGMKHDQLVKQVILLQGFYICTEPIIKLFQGSDLSNKACLEFQANERLHQKFI